MADHAGADGFLHPQKFFLLAFEHAVDRHTRPTRDDAGNVIGRHRLFDHHRALAITGFGVLQLTLERRNSAIGNLAGLRQIAAALRLSQFGACGVQLFLELLRGAEAVLFSFPASRHHIGLFLELRDRLFQSDEALLGAWIGFLLQCLALDLHLHEITVDDVQFLGLAVDLHLEARCCLVHQVDGFVGQKAVRDVAVGERRRRHQRAVGDAHAVVQLVALFQATQDRDGIHDIGLIDEHRLKPARQCGVFFDVLSIFVERRGADAVQLATRQRRFQKIASIHRTLGFARADDGVQFVDEQDDAASLRLDLLQHGFQPLLELPAILRASHQRAHVERQELLVLQALGHVAFDDALGQAFGNRRLADAGLTNQYGIVLGPARQHLDCAADLLVAADHRIDFSLGSSFRQIAGIALQGIVALLGGSGVGGAALAHVVDCAVQRLGRNACILQRCRGIARAFERDGQQQAFSGHELIAGFLGDLFRLIEDARQFRRQIDLARTTPRYLGPFGERSLGPGESVSGASTCSPNQTRCQALRIVQQHFQKMFRRDLLMALAKCQVLCGLNKAFSAIRELLDVHCVSPSTRHDMPRSSSRDRDLDQ